MPSPRSSDLKLSIKLFESMLDCYTRAREELLERRRGTADHVMVEIDERLAVNARATAAIRRTVEVLRDQLNLQRPTGHVGSASFATGEEA
jgi:hypothetical protein